MESIQEFIYKLIIEPSLLHNIVFTLIIIIVLWSIRKLFSGSIFKRIEDSSIRYRWNRILSYVLLVSGILLIGPMWISGLENTATYFGLLTAGLAIALQELIINIVGWVFILIRQPFQVGDRIQLGQYAGDVIDIQVFQFTLVEIGNWVEADQSTGRVIHIPNGMVFRFPLANYNQGFRFIWNEIPVLITFESDWKKAKEILIRIINNREAHFSESAQNEVKEASSRFLIFYTKLTPTVYTSVKDSGILLTVRYACEPRQRRGSTHTIWEDILDEFSKHTDIDFAYPTRRAFNNILEGKKEAEHISQ